MSVTPDHLENPERDLDLANRDLKGKPRAKGGAPPADELQALRQRLDTAKVAGADTNPHCADCFRRGWAAAVRAIAGE